MDSPIIERRIYMAPNGSHYDNGDKEEIPTAFSSRRRNDSYVYNWCRDTHKRIDERLQQNRRDRNQEYDKLHKRIDRVEEWGLRIILGILV